MKILPYLTLCLLFLAGCSEPQQPPALPKTAGEALRNCVESSGAKLDAAQADGDVASAAREIVQLLDASEDSPEMAPFEEFHRQMEQLERLAAKGPTAAELTSKISEIKELAEQLLTENQE